MKFKIADLFCGAGGTSSGAVEAAAALGRHPEVTAVNADGDGRREPAPPRQ